MKFFPHNGHEHIDCDGDPDLGLHRVLRGAEELFDAKMLFNPLEESFDEPPAAVQFRDCFCRQLAVVGEQNEMLVAGGVKIANAPEFFGILFFGVETAEGDELVASEPRCFVDGKGFEAVKDQIVLGPDDEGGGCLMDAKEAFEIGITTVHDVDGARLDDQFVEDVDVMHLAICDNDDGGNGAAQVEERVQLDRGLRPAEVRPGKDRETEVDDAGIEGIDGFLKHQAEVVVETEPPGLHDQHLGEVGIDAPVADLVCIGQGVAGHLAADTHVIKLLPGSAKAGLDVTQAFAVRQLGEGHAAELVAA